MFELGLQCPQQRVEQLVEALEALDAQSVSVEDADALSDAETALFGEPGMPPPRMGWRRSRITALFTTQEDAQYAQRLLGEAELMEGCSTPVIAALPEQDWVRLTQAQFAPVAITPEFWIVPSWHEAPAPARKIIRLDPGMAFGTGTHPTTSMCLHWIATRESNLGRVLDYGCGSGILGIAAALFGAVTVDAVDIDPAAVVAAQHNAEANRTRLRCGTPELAQGRYNTVVANILASPLKVLAALLCAHVAPGGNLVLAGILERQAHELQEAYLPYARLDCTASKDGWVLMTATL